jgi:hypothetical protein
MLGRNPAPGAVCREGEVLDRANRSWNRLIGCVLLVVALPAGAADRQDELFASWERTRKDVRSLVVEFTLTMDDRTFKERQQWEGTIRVLRGPADKVSASYEAREKKPKAERGGYLLSGGKAYLLNHDRKTAMKFDLAGRDVLHVVEETFNPFVAFLSRERATEIYRIEVIAQDERHTHLRVRPKRPGRSAVGLDEGRAVLVNQATDAVPRDLPQRIWYTDGHREYTLTFRAWRLNPATPPQLKEFERPEGWPGWQVFEWPFQTVKR